MVGVLVLVDEDIAELLLVELPDILVLLEEPDGVEDDVVKVQGPGGPELLLIRQVDVGDLLEAEVPLGPALVHIFGGQEHFILGPGDVTQDGPGLEGLLVHVQLLQALLDDPEGVVGVVDGKGGGEAQLLNVPAEDPHASGMEGGRPDIIGIRADGGFQTLFQLSGGLVGEGDGDDLPGHGGLQGAQEAGTTLLLLGEHAPLGVGLEEGQVGFGDVIGDLTAVGGPAVF